MAKRTITKDEYWAAKENYYALKSVRKNIASIDTDVAREMLALIDERIAPFHETIRLWNIGIGQIKSVTVETED